MSITKIHQCSLFSPAFLCNSFLLYTINLDQLSSHEYVMLPQHPSVWIAPPWHGTVCVEQLTIKNMEWFSEKGSSTPIQPMTTQDHPYWASFRSNRRSKSRLPSKFWNIIYSLMLQVLYHRLNSIEKWQVKYR